jgi:hypothetical protein
MKMETYIITRFSILDVDCGDWIISRDDKDKEQLKKKLFDETRLREKFWAFENVTYRSIINQTNQNFFWMIFISNELPIKYKDKLYAYERHNVKIFEVINMAEFFNILKNSKYSPEYSTVRLDDDDGLNINFIKKVNNIYRNSRKTEILSFPFGIKFTRKDGEIFIEKKKMNKPKIALGLTKFNGNIYSCRDHRTDILQRNETQCYQYSCLK